MAAASIGSDVMTVALSTVPPMDVAAEGHHREDEVIQVVVDVEVTREPRAREGLLVPPAVGSLGVEEIAHAAGNDRPSLLERQKGEEGPGGLAGRGVPSPPIVVVAIGAQV